MLSNKTAIVTGAGSGIGKAIANHLALQPLGVLSGIATPTEAVALGVVGAMGLALANPLWLAMLMCQPANLISDAAFWLRSLLF